MHNKLDEFIVQNEFITDESKIKNYKVSVVTKPKPIFKIVDNGNKVLTKENIDELIIEPVYEEIIYDKTENNKQNYALLTPEEFQDMTDEDIKSWYKKTKK